MNRKSIFLMFTLLLLLVWYTPQTSAAETQPANAIKDPAPSMLGESGIVQEVRENQLTIETKNASYPVLTLNLSDNTIVMDNKTGFPSSVSDLKKGDGIYAYFSPAMTRSIPPQSTAIAILTNFTAGKDTPAHLLTVGSIEHKPDGSIRFLTADGSMLVTVTEKTPVSFYASTETAGLEDIKIGSTLFAWYQVVALSYPGQAGADKIVLLPAIEPAVSSVTVNGQPLNIKTYIDHGNIMLPVRTVGEALGFTVTWNPADTSVSLDNGKVKTKITLGRDSYYKASSKAIGLTAPFAFGSAPAVKNGRIYVPAQLFTLLFSDDNAVTLTNGVLNIAS